MAARQDLIIRQGETWSFTWTKKDSAGSAVSVAGYSARMSIRGGYGGELQAYLTDGSDADGGTITLGGALGTVVLAMTAAQTAALIDSLSSLSLCLATGTGEAASTVRFLYDLELVSAAGAVTRELEGRVIVQREVTA